MDWRRGEEDRSVCRPSGGGANVCELLGSSSTFRPAVDRLIVLCRLMATSLEWSARRRDHGIVLMMLQGTVGFGSEVSIL